MNPKPSQVVAAPANGEPSHRCRILVTDDEDAIRCLNAEALRRLGYEVDMAEDGSVAWAALNTGRYDLLITDNKMPNVTGLELLEKVHNARMSLPAIMVTGTLPAEELARKPWLIPAAMLLKPYTMQELAVAVHETLSAKLKNRKQRSLPRNWRSLPSKFEGEG